MTLRRIPLLPTLIVLIAVGVMVRLGFWQIDRMDQKEALLARYATAESMNADIAPDQLGGAPEAILYRHTRFTCSTPRSQLAIAGRNAKGESGIAQTALCDTQSTGSTLPVTVTLGWSSDPAPVAWSGGEVAGVIAPMGKNGVRVVADPPLAGLEANAKPDPKDLPNNHWSYAIQWFLFAATALVIYILALRKRLKG